LKNLLNKLGLVGLRLGLYYNKTKSGSGPTHLY
jgi:hypothetical protein